ncbi:hypothetical protein [uncultured Chitinophaga sp.]|jgi:hypothetical protein|uniref:hypothetical protein n=1 Tax=uncultured Chitinophaga sp. TaxID=339340 RepID=UPI00260AE28D|nr:hypothetical protein [uncultured Chitinophaga sp.]
MNNLSNPAPENILNDIYSRLMELPITFRNKIFEECSWSTPAFYRKARDAKGISNAEKDKIAAILNETFQNLWQYCEIYRKQQ